jgi:hypothetical protein
MTDPLAPYRKKPLETPAAVESKAAKEAYVAFSAKDRVERLRIRRAMAPTRSPRYLYLQDMAYDGGFGTNFVLCFEFMLVIVRGKNLQGMISALENDTADFIQEYHPDLWDKPADGEPIIESIEVVLQGIDSSASDANKLGETQH